MARTLLMRKVREMLNKMSETQRSMLQADGVEVGQGYLFARPLEASAIDGFLTTKVA